MRISNRPSKRASISPAAMPFDLALLGQAIGSQIVRHVTRALAPVYQRVVEVETKLAGLEARPQPKDGAGIQEAIQVDGVLKLTTNDGRILDAGLVRGNDGVVDYAKVMEFIHGEVQKAISTERDVLLHASELYAEQQSEERWKDVEQTIAAAIEEALVSNPTLDERLKATGERIDAIAARIDALPVPQDGKDADPALVAKLVAEHVAAAVDALPVPEDGKDADPEEVRKLVASEVAAAFATIPIPKDGVDGRDGEDGKDADPAEIAKLVNSEVFDQLSAMIPKMVTRAEVETIVAEKIAQIEPLDMTEFATLQQLTAAVATEVEAVVSTLPKPKDGTSVTLGDVTPLVSQAVDQAVAKLPPPRGLRSALIDREGNLRLTFTNGDVEDVGRVAGRDADMNDLRRRLGELIAEIPPAKDGVDGKDGLGFDDLDVEQTSERTIVLRFERDGIKKEFPILVPMPIYRGIYKPGKYQRGDLVTLGGSLWHCEVETEEKPGDTSQTWKLAVKRGRDGQDGRDLNPKSKVPLK